jgi:hypothetical protein
MRSVHMALCFARGLPGFMLPSPDAADSDEPKPQYKPAWLWNIVARIALRYWERQERKEKYARVREWFETRKDSAHDSHRALSSIQRADRSAQQPRKKF